MSLHAQRLNAAYIDEHFAGARLSFIACDAADLPLQDESVTCVTGFTIGNMLDRMRQGVAEARRVLVPRGSLVFDHVFVDEILEGWQAMSATLAEMGAAGHRYLGLDRTFVR